MGNEENKNVSNELEDTAEMEVVSEDSGFEDESYTEEEEEAPKKSKKWLLIPAAAVLIAGGVFAWMKFGGGSSSGQKAYVMAVSDVSSNAYISGVNQRFTGTVEAQSTKTVNPDSSRKLGETYVKEGDEVHAGDRLFSYDVSDLQLQLSQLDVDRQRINAQISDKKENIAELKSQKAQASSEMQMEYSIEIQQAETELKSLQYDLEAKQLEIDQTNKDLNNTDVTSPIDGIVKSVNESALSGGSGYDYGDSSSSAYITIVASGNYVVKGKVSEMQLSSVAQGMPVLVRSRVDEKETWTGSISSVETGETVQNENSGYYYSSGGGESASKYAFYVALDSADNLIIGQHVTIEPSVEGTETYDGILLGEWYIGDVDSNPWVYVDDNGKLKKQSVTIGKYNENTAEYEILSGLEADDLIAYPEESIKEGMATTQNYEESVDAQSFEDDYSEENFESSDFTEGDYVEGEVIEGDYVEGEVTEGEGEVTESEGETVQEAANE